jgi:hypothetical protein
MARLYLRPRLRLPDDINRDLDRGDRFPVFEPVQGVPVLGPVLVIVNRAEDASELDVVWRGHPESRHENGRAIGRYELGKYAWLLS